MPDERNIEKQLRAIADKRRREAGAPFEMHPATRRMLQGEVLRARGTKAAPETKSFFARLFEWQWPPLAWVCSALVILAFGTWTYMRTVPKMKKETQTVFNGEIAGYVQTAAPPKPAELNKELAMQRSVGGPAPSVAAESAVPPASMPVPAESPAPGFYAGTSGVDKSGERKDTALGVEADRAIAAAAPATPAAQPADALAMLRDNRAASQNFSFRNEASQLAAVGGKVDELAKSELNQKLDGAATKAKEETVLLANFQVEQSGDTIRIIDGDGSVYSGTLLAADDAKQSKVFYGVAVFDSAVEKSAPASKKAPATVTPLPRIQNVRFVAAGTNVSLKQNVAITGEIVSAGMATTNALSFSNAATNQAQMVNSGLWLSNGRIVGRAVTSDGREIQLNAAPVAP